jgi:hypothetical protein
MPSGRARASAIVSAGCAPLNRRWRLSTKDGTLVMPARLEEAAWARTSSTASSERRRLRVASRSIPFAAPISASTAASPMPRPSLK